MRLTCTWMSILAAAASFACLYQEDRTELVTGTGCVLLAVSVVLLAAAVVVGS